MGLFTVCGSLSALFAGACAPAESVARPAPPDVDVPLRAVRVRIGTELPRLRVRAESVIQFLAADGKPTGSRDAGAWHVIESTGSAGLVVDAARGFAAELELSTVRGGPISVAFQKDAGWSKPQDYPGRLRITADSDGRLSVVNLVDVERYVACVAARETWPGFTREAYRVSAIAARTYVLYQMHRRRDAAYDVTAGQGAQVYKGLRSDASGRLADNAAKRTRGLVCTYRKDGKNHLFSTYYSAVCGGYSQPAVIFGKADDVEPLRGGVACDYCRIAPAGTYRWGPVRLTTTELKDRLLARYPELASLGDIKTIDVLERTDQGRPVRLRFTGATGKTHDMLAERFRLAVGSETVRSTDCDIAIHDGEVVFKNGRGFGHGLGLCQWGTQGQALAGKKAGEILRYYYPGSGLTRVY